MTKLTPSQLNISPQTSQIATDQSTTSTTYGDLATVGPQVTITVGASGMALAIWGAGIYNAAAVKMMGIAVSGANTIAPSDSDGIRNDNAAFIGKQQGHKLFTGLTPGSTTFTAKYRTAAGTANFFERILTVIPL